MFAADDAISSIDDRVLVLWRDIFERPDVQAGDDFFELGGHSILIITMISRAEEEFGVRIALRDFFEAPTPERMAAMLRAAALGVEPGDGPAIRSGDPSLEELLAQVESLPDTDADGTTS